MYVSVSGVNHYGRYLRSTFTEKQNRVKSRHLAKKRLASVLRPTSPSDRR